MHDAILEALGEDELERTRIRYAKYLKLINGFVILHKTQDGRLDKVGYGSILPFGHTSE